MPHVKKLLKSDFIDFLEFPKSPNVSLQSAPKWRLNL